MKYNFTVTFNTKNSPEFSVTTEQFPNPKVRKVEFILSREELDTKDFCQSMSAMTLKLVDNNLRPKTDMAEFIDATKEQPSSSSTAYVSQNNGPITEEFLQRELHTRFMNNVDDKLLPDLLDMLHSTELTQRLENAVEATGVVYEFDGQDF